MEELQENRKNRQKLQWLTIYIITFKWIKMLQKHYKKCGINSPNLLFKYENFTQFKCLLGVVSPDID